MKRTRNMMGAALFTALMIMSSYVTIPVGPVPVTLQTLMAQLAGVTVVCYIIGAIGFRLSFAFFLHKPMTWEKTLALSVAPFLPLDIVKAFVTAFLGIRIRRALKAGGMWE